MDISQIITPVHLYFLDLLSMEYINLQQSYIGADGSVYFNLNLKKLPIPNIEIPVKSGLVGRYTSVEGVLRDWLFRTTFFHNRETDLKKQFIPNSKDEYYIQFLPERNRAETFSVKHDKKIYSRSEEYLSYTLFLMKAFQHPKFQAYNEAYNKFIQQAMDWTKEQITAILTDLKGEYVKDTISKDTYFQVRHINGQNIYYIIYRWWDKVKQGNVTWVDSVNGEGTVFIALND